MSRVASSGEPLLTVERLCTFFGARGASTIRAVDDVSLTLNRGQTLGIVGESGCGKSTLARTILRLIPHHSGRVWFDGVDVLDAGRRELKRLRRRMQIVFQDPYSSLNPRMRVGRIIGESLVAHRLVASRSEQRRRVDELLEQVGLQSGDADRFPHMFSGGQRQRIGIARALAMKPDLVICDEPVSALDVSIQAQILNLLSDLQDELGLAFLFIAHDLAVVRHFCPRVAVMYSGKIVEMSDTESLFTNPTHAYTKTLLSAIPTGVRAR